MWMCSACLVGAMVPVIRPSTKRWEFGTIERAFWGNDDGNTATCGGNDSEKHHLRFMDSHCEWATVEVRAYDHYIDYFQRDCVVTEAVSFNGSSGPFDFDETIDVDDLDAVATPRRLETSFASEKDGGFAVDLPLVNVAASAHASAGETPNHHRHRSRVAMTPQSATSDASSLSISTMDGGLMVDGDVSLGTSPYTTPSKSTCSSRRGNDSASTSPRYSQRLWTPEVRRFICLLACAFITIITTHTFSLSRKTRFFYGLSHPRITQPSNGQLLPRSYLGVAESSVGNVISTTLHPVLNSRTGRQWRTQPFSAFTLRMAPNGP